VEAGAALTKQDVSSISQKDARDNALAIGRLLLLAGRTVEATPFLERAARRCDVIGDVLFLDLPLLEATSSAVHAHVLLGALEASGDKAAACREYGVVQTRWHDAGAALRHAQEGDRTCARAGLHGNAMRSRCPTLSAYARRHAGRRRLVAKAKRSTSRRSRA
jgi:hypothetical protein